MKAPNPAVSTEHLIRQSEHLIEEGELDAALDLLEGVLASSPENVNALNNAALISLDLGDPVKGAEYLEKALEVDPSHEASFYNLLDFAIEEREFELAKEIYENHQEHISPSKEKATYQKHLFPRFSSGQARVQGDLEEALEASTRALGQDASDADAAHDAGLAAWELGHLIDAIEYFERALETQPGHQAAFYSLIDLLIDQESNELAVETFLRYHEEMPDDEEKAKYSDALATWADQQPSGEPSGDGAAGQAVISPGNSFPTPGSEDKLKIAIVCGPDRKFITDIEKGLREKGHAVHPCYLDDKIDLQRIQQAMDWADVTWFEWCDQILVEASQKLRKTSKVVCRLHRYESFSDYPMQVNWSFLDTLIFSSDHISGVLQDRIPDLKEKVDLEIIHTGIDLERFAFTERDAGFDIAYLGYLHHRKNPSLLLQCMHALVKTDDRYKLHIAGYHQQPVWKLYFEHMIDQLDLQNHVKLYGWVDDIETWLEDKQHLISTSIHEGNPYGIAEGMARGLKPLIHNFVDAEDLYPREWLFDTVGEFVERATAEEYQPSAYRTYIRENYALGDKIDQVEKLFNRLRLPVPAAILPSLTADSNEGKPRSGSATESAGITVQSDNSHKKKHLLIVSQPRSGTTLLWKTLRQDSRLCCYDEPFNRHYHLNMHAGRDNNRNTFTEYLEELELVRSHWSTIQPYEEFIPRFIGHQERYLQQLLGTADNVCIDFIEVNAKLSHLREIAPDALIIHLVRDPRAWVTSHLRPYGDWLPGLPKAFFSHSGWFNYWSRQDVARHLGLKGYAHEQLLQIWNRHVSAAEETGPDITLQFEHFCREPRAVLRQIYEYLDIEYCPLNISDIRLPNAPFEQNNEAWQSAINMHLSDKSRQFLASSFATRSAHNKNLRPSKGRLTNTH